MLDWLFKRNPNKSGFEPVPQGDSLLMSEFGSSNRIVPAMGDPTQVKEREIPDIYVRDGRRGMVLDAISELPECNAAIRFWVDAMCSSSDGDDRGVAIAEHIDRKNTIPVDPQIEEIAEETIDRVFSGDILQGIAKRMLKRGDDFEYVNIEKGKVSELIYLPTWQMFRREEKGKVEGFYFKEHSNDEKPIRYDPKTCYHFRFRPSGKYGEALFKASERDAEFLLKRLTDLDFAARASAIDPLVHEMPACATQDYLKQYKTAYQKKAAVQPITDFFMMQGGKLYRASGGNTPNLAAILGALNFNQIRLLMPCGVPFYLLGLNTHGAKDIAGEPAQAFARSIATLRANIATEMRKVIDLQLTLSGVPKERQKYRFVWPKIVINPYGQPQEQTDETDNTDTEK